eukprot:CAMPEP_0119087030 /NCGR_PEP_ID=MMETSP1178-20130426/140198_1 /TAXON_ID=33656 /ORGANISM="unid sp, Strain CCMP2000" /LENGTH=50 /DNA_ID=CAMNT_0007070201 /DNA_START=37 /DNA_END=185 /DNA_ORIENTATION=+
MAIAADGEGEQTDEGVLGRSDGGSGNPLYFNLGIILARGDARGAGLLRAL